ncbi:hypothetical protein O3P69_007543 [Scylla paramamosain]|uniref:Uncharacterized protein n=1 Tax=Scylla paramamosain TaxID=85552 RepID=A0AAW0UYP1_SCYPA
MKNTPAFLLLPVLLVLLLAPKGFLGSSLTPQCSISFKTSDQNYEYVNITTVNRTMYDQINSTIYVSPQQGMPMKVVLEVKGQEGVKTNTEFSLEEGCFEGDMRLRELFVKVKLMNMSQQYQKVTTRYKFQVRTSTCIKPCTSEAYMIGIHSLHVLASGVSQWSLEHPGENCGDIPKWNKTKYEGSFPTCILVYYKKPSSLSTTIPAKTPTTTATPTTSPATPITSSTPITTTSMPSPAVIGGITGVVAGIIAVALVAVVRKRRGETAIEGVLMRPKIAELPREESVNSLYEPAGRREPVYETIDRQGSVNSLYETIDRRGSVNSLYEPLENFRSTRT